MIWQEVIFNRLNIQREYPKLILDKTGVLISRQFTYYIEAQSIHYSVAQSISDILSLIKENSLILCFFIELPSYILDKIDITIFDYNHLPIEINYTLAKSLKPETIISLLDYKFNNKSLKLIDETNIKDELLLAIQYEKHQKAQKLKNKLSIIKTLIIKDFEDVLELGNIWGEYIYACFNAEILPDEYITTTIDKIVETSILNGCLKNAFYATENDFKTVNKILSYIKSKNKEKIALITFDGIGMAEWMLFKDYLAPFGFTFSEKSLFSLIPTITKISRSAIYYGDSISVYSLKTPNEEKKLKEYFSNMTCRFYKEGDINGEDSVLGIDFVSIIYNAFDEIAHSTKIPPGEKTKFIYFNNLLTYLNKSSIKDELLLLKHLDYNIFICSDHGCVVAEGNGQEIDKYLIEAQSKRATLITKTELSSFYDVNHYKIPFLSDDKVALLSKNRTIFTSKNITAISHGGITLDELIVPFAEVI
ncbi:MAG: PglZ domain-containing protein [Desulfobacterales bacterium]|nr:PglZ domain-containing protein [Desulfobacterales bacterium]